METRDERMQMNSESSGGMVHLQSDLVRHELAPPHSIDSSSASPGDIATATADDDAVSSDASSRVSFISAHCPSLPVSLHPQSQSQSVCGALHLLDFGEVALGSTRTCALTLTNHTDEATECIISYTSSYGTVSVSPHPRLSLAGRSSCVVQISVTPRQPNPAYHKWIRIDNERNSPNTISLLVRSSNVTDPHGARFHSQYYEVCDAHVGRVSLLPDGVTEINGKLHFRSSEEESSGKASVAGVGGAASSVDAAALSSSSQCPAESASALGIDDDSDLPPSMSVPDSMADTYHSRSTSRDHLRARSSASSPMPPVSPIGVDATNTSTDAAAAGVYSTQPPTTQLSLSHQSSLTVTPTAVSSSTPALAPPPMSSRASTADALSSRGTSGVGGLTTPTAASGAAASPSPRLPTNVIPLGTLVCHHPVVRVVDIRNVSRARLVLHVATSLDADRIGSVSDVEEIRLLVRDEARFQSESAMTRDAKSGASVGGANPSATKPVDPIGVSDAADGTTSVAGDEDLTRTGSSTPPPPPSITIPPTPSSSSTPPSPQPPPSAISSLPPPSPTGSALPTPASALPPLVSPQPPLASILPPHLAECWSRFMATLVDGESVGLTGRFRDLAAERSYVKKFILHRRDIDTVLRERLLQPMTVVQTDAMMMPVSPMPQTRSIGEDAATTSAETTNAAEPPLDDGDANRIARTMRVMILEPFETKQLFIYIHMRSELPTRASPISPAPAVPSSAVVGVRPHRGAASTVTFLNKEFAKNRLIKLDEREIYMRDTQTTLPTSEEAAAAAAAAATKEMQDKESTAAPIANSAVRRSALSTAESVMAQEPIDALAAPSSSSSSSSRSLLTSPRPSPVAVVPMISATVTDGIVASTGEATIGTGIGVGTDVGSGSANFPSLSAPGIRIFFRLAEFSDEADSTRELAHTTQIAHTADHTLTTSADSSLSVLDETAAASQSAAATAANPPSAPSAPAPLQSTAPSFRTSYPPAVTPPLRSLLLPAFLCRSALEVAQQHINFGQLLDMSVHSKTLLLSNLSSVPLLFQVQQTGSIASLDLTFPKGDIGVIPPRGRSDLPFLFRPSLAGKFLEPITILNVEDHTNTRVINVKAYLKKPQHFWIQNLQLDFNVCCAPDKPTRLRLGPNDGRRRRREQPTERRDATAEGDGEGAVTGAEVEPVSSKKESLLPPLRRAVSLPASASVGSLPALLPSAASASSLLTVTPMTATSSSSSLRPIFLSTQRIVVKNISLKARTFKIQLVDWEKRMVRLARRERDGSDEEEVEGEAETQQRVEREKTHSTPADACGSVGRRGDDGRQEESDSAIELVSAAVADIAADTAACTPVAASTSSSSSSSSSSLPPLSRLVTYPGDSCPAALSLSCLPRLTLKLEDVALGASTSLFEREEEEERLNHKLRIAIRKKKIEKIDKLRNRLSELREMKMERHTAAGQSHGQSQAAHARDASHGADGADSSHPHPESHDSREGLTFTLEPNAVQNVRATLTIVDTDERQHERRRREEERDQSDEDDEEEDDEDGLDTDVVGDLHSHPNRLADDACSSATARRRSVPSSSPSLVEFYTGVLLVFETKNKEVVEEVKCAVAIASDVHTQNHFLAHRREWTDSDAEQQDDEEDEEEDDAAAAEKHSSAAELEDDEEVQQPDGDGDGDGDDGDGADEPDDGDEAAVETAIPTPTPTADTEFNSICAPDSPPSLFASASAPIVAVANPDSISVALTSQTATTIASSDSHAHDAVDLRAVLPLCDVRTSPASSHQLSVSSSSFVSAASSLLRPAAPSDANSSLILLAAPMSLPPSLLPPLQFPHAFPSWSSVHSSADAAARARLSQSNFYRMLYQQCGDTDATQGGSREKQRNDESSVDAADGSATAVGATDEPSRALPSLPRSMPFAIHVPLEFVASTTLMLSAARDRTRGDIFRVYAESEVPLSLPAPSFFTLRSRVPAPTILELRWHPHTDDAQRPADGGCMRVFVKPGAAAVMMTTPTSSTVNTSPLYVPPPASHSHTHAEAKRLMARTRSHATRDSMRATNPSPPSASFLASALFASSVPSSSSLAPPPPAADSIVVVLPAHDELDIFLCWLSGADALDQLATSTPMRHFSTHSAMTATATTTATTRLREKRLRRTYSAQSSDPTLHAHHYEHAHATRWRRGASLMDSSVVQEAILLPSAPAVSESESAAAAPSAAAAAASASLGGAAAGTGCEHAHTPTLPIALPLTSPTTHNRVSSTIDAFDVVCVPSVGRRSSALQLRPGRANSPPARPTIVRSATAADGQLIARAMHFPHGTLVIQPVGLPHLRSSLAISVCAPGGSSSQTAVSPLVLTPERIHAGVVAIDEEYERGTSGLDAAHRRAIDGSLQLHLPRRRRRAGIVRGRFILYNSMTAHPASRIAGTPTGAVTIVIGQQTKVTLTSAFVPSSSRAQFAFRPSRLTLPPNTRRVVEFACSVRALGHQTHAIFVRDVTHDIDLVLPVTFTAKTTNYVHCADVADGEFDAGLIDVNGEEEEATTTTVAASDVVVSEREDDHALSSPAVRADSSSPLIDFGSSLVLSRSARRFAQTVPFRMENLQSVPLRVQVACTVTAELHIFDVAADPHLRHCLSCAQAGSDCAAPPPSPLTTPTSDPGEASRSTSLEGDSSDRVDDPSSSVAPPTVASEAHRSPPSSCAPIAPFVPLSARSTRTLIFAFTPLRPTRVDDSDYRRRLTAGVTFTVFRPRRDESEWSEAVTGTGTATAIEAASEKRTKTEDATPQQCVATSLSVARTRPSGWSASPPSIRTLPSAAPDRPHRSSVRFLPEESGGDSHVIEFDVDTEEEEEDRDDDEEDDEIIPPNQHGDEDDEELSAAPRPSYSPDARQHELSLFDTGDDDDDADTDSSPTTTCDRDSSQCAGRTVPSPLGRRVSEFRVQVTARIGVSRIQVELIDLLRTAGTTHRDTTTHFSHLYRRASLIEFRTAAGDGDAAEVVRATVRITNGSSLLPLRYRLRPSAEYITVTPASGYLAPALDHTQGSDTKLIECGGGDSVASSPSSSSSSTSILVDIALRCDDGNDLYQQTISLLDCRDRVLHTIFLRCLVSSRLIELDLPVRRIDLDTSERPADDDHAGGIAVMRDCEFDMGAVYVSPDLSGPHRRGGEESRGKSSASAVAVTDQTLRVQSAQMPIVTTSRRAHRHRLLADILHPAGAIDGGDGAAAATTIAASPLLPRSTVAVAAAAAALAKTPNQSFSLTMIDKQLALGSRLAAHHQQTAVSTDDAAAPLQLIEEDDDDQLTLDDETTATLIASAAVDASEEATDSDGVAGAHSVTDRLDSSFASIRTVVPVHRSFTIRNTSRHTQWIWMRSAAHEHLHVRWSSAGVRGDAECTTETNHVGESPSAAATATLSPLPSVGDSGGSSDWSHRQESTGVAPVCSCGASVESTFTPPSVDLRPDGSVEMRYHAHDAHRRDALDGGSSEEESLTTDVPVVGSAEMSRPASSPSLMESIIRPLRAPFLSPLYINSHLTSSGDLLSESASSRRASGQSTRSPSASERRSWANGAAADGCDRDREDAMEDESTKTQQEEESDAAATSTPPSPPPPPPHHDIPCERCDADPLPAQEASSWSLAECGLVSSSLLGSSCAALRSIGYDTHTCFGLPAHLPMRPLHSRSAAAAASDQEEGAIRPADVFQLPSGRSVCAHLTLTLDQYHLSTKEEIRAMRDGRRVPWSTIVSVHTQAATDLSSHATAAVSSLSSPIDVAPGPVAPPQSPSPSPSRVVSRAVRVTAALVCSRSVWRMDPAVRCDVSSSEAVHIDSSSERPTADDAHTRSAAGADIDASLVSSSLVGRFTVHDIDLGAIAADASSSTPPLSLVHRLTNCADITLRVRVMKDTIPDYLRLEHEPDERDDDQHQNEADDEDDEPPRTQRDTDRTIVAPPSIESISILSTPAWLDLLVPPFGAARIRATIDVTKLADGPFHWRLPIFNIRQMTTDCTVITCRGVKWTATQTDTNRT